MLLVTVRNVLMTLVIRSVNTMNSVMTHSFKRAHGWSFILFIPLDNFRVMVVVQQLCNTRAEVQSFSQNILFLSEAQLEECHMFFWLLRHCSSFLLFSYRSVLLSGPLSVLSILLSIFGCFSFSGNYVASHRCCIVFVPKQRFVK